MNGDMVIKLNDMELEYLLKNEFLVEFNRWKSAEVERARAALKAYESVEAFLTDTRWELDNPESHVEAYLTENRICRWYQGTLYYFSAILWEEMRGEA